MENLLELNIGLLRNTDKRPNDVSYITSVIKEDFGNHDFRLVSANGNWGEEVTYVASVPLLSSSVGLIDTILRYMCVEFNQDAIAYMLNGKGKMVFNPNYMGEKFEFNINYFEKY
jgi:hypothetical protein